jgi:DNA primase
MKTKWKDFATGEIGDVFDMLMKMFNTDMYGALCVINDRMKLGLGYGRKAVVSEVEKMQRVYAKKAKVLIQIEPKEYSDFELEYWAQFGITKETLAFNNVYSCDRVFMNRRLVNVSRPNDPTFAYHFPNSDNIKIYKPLNKEFKWFGNVEAKDIYGYKSFKEHGHLIITSSGKDVMTLQELGYMAVAPQGEGNHFSGNLEEMIRLSKQVFLFYDNDKAGKTNSQTKAEQYGAHQIFTPTIDEKDPSDFVRTYGKEALKTYVDDAIIQLLSAKPTRSMGETLRDLPGL